MTKVHIYGRMGEVLGSYHEFACNRLNELFQAIECNTGKFKKYIINNKKRGIAIFVDGVALEPCDLRESFINIKNKTVKIVPLLVGAGFFTWFATVLIVKAGISVGVAKAISFVVSAVLLTAVAVGIQLLIASLFAPDKPDGASSNSYSFGSAENVTRQGLPVPVGYGRFKVGSVVLSASVMNIEKTYAKGSNFYATLRSALGRQRAQINTRAESSTNSVEQLSF